MVLTRYGDWEIPETEDLLARFRRNYGEWAFLEFELLRHNVPQGSRFFDAGAYIGKFSLGALLWSPAQLVALDGNSKVIAALNANMEKNLTVPHVVVQGLIGTESGRMVTGTYVQQANLRSVTFSDSVGQTGAEVGDAVEVAIATLEASRGAHGDYDVLKLDVKSCERDVLDSDAQWIRVKKTDHLAKMQ